MKEKNPLISVVVPIYNVEKYLHRCVNSILAQTLSDLELILVDDGSSDCSSVICDDYSHQDSRVRVLHKHNGGVSSARNAGIEVAHGEWICFVDSDDYVEEDYLDNFHLNGTGVDLFAQGYSIKQGESVRTIDIKHTDRMTSDELVLALEVNNVLNSPCFKLFRTSIIIDKGIRFNQCMSYGEDHLFTLQYMHYVKNVKYSAGSKYVYYQETTESLTRRAIQPSVLIKYINEIVPEIEFMSKKFSFGEKKTHEVINRRVHFHIHRSVNNYVKCGCDKETLQQIKKTLRNNLKGYEGLNKKQKLFLKLIMAANSSLLSIFLMVNNKIRLSERIKIGF